MNPIWLAVAVLLIYGTIMIGVSFMEPRSPVGDWLLRILGTAGLGCAVWFAWAIG